MYRKGQGVPQDDVRALMWFDIAAGSPDLGKAQKAAGDRDALAGSLSESQVQQAQQFAQVCRDSRYRQCE
jgi:TPR repeat protein